MSEKNSFGLDLEDDKNKQSDDIVNLLELLTNKVNIIKGDNTQQKRNEEALVALKNDLDRCIKENEELKFVIVNLRKGNDESLQEVEKYKTLISTVEEKYNSQQKDAIENQKNYTKKIGELEIKVKSLKDKLSSATEMLQKLINQI
jgi:hypothetical protein